MIRDLQGSGILATVAATALAATAGCGIPEPAPDRGRDADVAPARIAIIRPPASLDPHRHSDTISWQISRNLFEGLVVADRNGGVRPGIAASWSNPDDRTWDFRLREGVVFHDGRPVRTEDVLASLRRPSTDPDSVYGDALSHVATLDSPEPGHLRVVTREPDPVLLYRLLELAILPEGRVDEEAPVGTGPYRLVGAGANEIELAAFEAYWGERPTVPGAVFVVEPSISEGRNRLLAGDLDLTVLRLGELAEVEASPDHAILSPLAGAVFFLTLPVTEAPWDDPRVREALDLAIDRELYVRPDERPANGVPASQMVAPSTFGYDPSIGVTRPDPERARRLLDEAGLEELVVDVAHIDRQAIPRLIGSVDPASGIQIVSRPLAVEEFRRRSVTGELGVTWSAVLHPAGDGTGLFEHRAHSTTPDGAWGRSNVVGFRDAEIDRLVEAAAVQLEPEVRGSLLRAAMRRLVASRVYLPVHYPVQFFGVGPRFEWQARDDGTVRLVDARPRVTTSSRP